MRIPAIYRLDDGDGQTEPRISETIVWIVEWVIVPANLESRYSDVSREALRAVCIGPNGIPFLAPAWMLEVVSWPDDDDALKLARPPSYSGDTDKVTSINQPRD